MVIEGTSVHTFACDGVKTRAYLYGVDVKAMVDNMDQELFTEMSYYSAIRKERETNEANNTEPAIGHCACDSCACDRED